MRSVDHVKKWQIYLQEAKTQAEFASRCYEVFKKAERAFAVAEFSYIFTISSYTRATLIEFLTQSPARIVTLYSLAMLISQGLTSSHFEDSETTLSISTNVWIGGCASSMVRLSLT
jgi:hypothetical protein